jgi:hypothetical protein
MSEERKLVLEMLSAGKINVAEAEKLLEAAAVAEQGEALISKSLNKKFLRVLVKEENNTKVNINIPIALAEVGLKLVPKDALKVDGKIIDINEILKLVAEGNDGELVNIDSMDNGKEVKVKVSIE